MSKTSCVSRLLYEDTRSLRSKLLYGNYCRGGTCSCGHNGSGDGNCGCEDSGCGWGIRSVTTYNSAEFNGF